jgi:hypothetical protein
MLLGFTASCGVSFVACKRCLLTLALAYRAAKLLEPIKTELRERQASQAISSLLQWDYSLDVRLSVLE